MAYRKYIINPLNKGKFDIGADENALNSEFVNKGGDTMTGDLNFDNAGITNVDVVEFNTLYTTTGNEPQGSVFWNSTDGTLDVVLNGVNLHIGQQLYFYGKASGTITKGDLVQFAGVQGSHILIKKCVVAEIQANPTYFIGVASENLTNGDFGYVVWFGYVNDVYTNTPDNGDSSNWATGDILYFSNTTGGLTKTLPTKTDTEIEVSAVVKTQTGNSQTGRILVRPTIYHELGELSDVLISNPQTKDLLKYDTNKWVNFTPQYPTYFGEHNTDPTGITPINGDHYWNNLDEKIQVYINRWRELNGPDRFQFTNGDDFQFTDSRYFQFTG